MVVLEQWLSKQNTQWYHWAPKAYLCWGLRPMDCELIDWVDLGTMQCLKAPRLLCTARIENHCPGEDIKLVLPDIELSNEVFYEGLFLKEQRMNYG